MVHHMTLDPRDNSIYAATNSGTLDGVVQRTSDFGATWERRSENRGDDWTEITEGLPSQFGFPFAIHSQDPGTIYVVPLTDDGNRVAAALCECIRGRRRRPLASRRRQSDPGWTAGLDRGQYCGRA